MQGRHDEAVAAVRKAVELDPVALPVNTSLGMTLYYAGRRGDAIPQLQKTVELDPAFSVPYTYLGLCSTLIGRHEDAILQHQALIDRGNLSRSGDLALFAFSLAKAVRIAEARKVASQLEIKSKSEYVDRNDLAIALYGIGELDATFAALLLAVEQRSPGVRCIRVEPVFGEDLRSDPRYFELLRRIGL